MAVVSLATAAVVGSGEGVSRADSVVTAKGYACGYKMDVVIDPILTTSNAAVRYIRGCDQDPADGSFENDMPNEAADAESTEVGPETMLTTSNTQYIDSFTTLRKAYAAGTARIFSAGTMESEIVGRRGPSSAQTDWEATVSNTIGDINKTDYRPLWFPPEVFTADEVYSECKANPSDVVKRRTTVTNGSVYADSGLDLNRDGDFVDAGEHEDATVSVPTNPPAGHTIRGHFHFQSPSEWKEEHYTYTFNEQVASTDDNGLGLLTVYGAHLRMLGPALAHGDLWVGRADCGVTTPPS